MILSPESEFRGLCLRMLPWAVGKKEKEEDITLSTVFPALLSHCSQDPKANLLPFDLFFLLSRSQVWGMSR